MNRYDEILDWLQNTHNEVFNQWVQIEEVMRLKEEQKEKAEEKARFERAREQWEEKKTKIQAFLDSEDSNELSKDLKKAIQFNLDIAGHELNGKIIEPYHAWQAIRAILKGRPNNPIKAGGVLL